MNGFLDRWVDWTVGVILALLGWIAKTNYQRLGQVERDMFLHREDDQRFHSTIEARVAVVEQSTRDIGGRLDRIESKLDRLLERT